MPSSSNLHTFLEHTTPTVRSRLLHKNMRSGVCVKWQPFDKETIECFSLEDFWEVYEEWSVYGCGIPVLLNNGEMVVQYYVPYLSALQIFTSNSFRNPMTDESEVGELESDSWSDDSESDRLSRSLSNGSSWGWEDVASDDSSFERGVSWPMRDRLGYLYCNYIEWCPPNERMPLSGKINELARSYPSLMRLRSVDLSPASWMAVAWYPIYHIPSKRNVKDLSASFLTYHTLSSTFQDNNTPNEIEGCGQRGKSLSAIECVEEVKCKKDNNGISLLPFGLATYKMQESFWMDTEDGDDEGSRALLSAADSWLKQLRVSHHDFNYFTSHSN